LEKKSAGFTKAWEKRYFAIKNDKMYWYNNDRAREALNHLELKGIRRCTPIKECNFELVFNLFKFNYIHFFSRILMAKFIT